MRIRISLKIACLSLVLFGLTGFPLGSLHARQQKPAPTPATKPKAPKFTSHVVLISISGLRTDHANNPESFRLKIPNIQSLRAKGSYAIGIEGVYPSQTIPAHVSMVTGVLPADHGITSDYAFDEQTGMQSAEPFQSAKAIKTDKIWEAAKRENLTTAAVGFPVTAEADITFNFPEANNEADSVKTERAISLIEKSSPNLLLLNFASFATAQHHFGLLSAEAKSALEQIDGFVGRIIAAVERAHLTSETTFMVVSDQGVSKVEREFRPNALLAKKGFLTVEGKGAIKDWRAVAQSFGGSAAIFLKNPQDESAMRELETLFTEFDQDSDNPLWRVINRREAIRLGANPRPALYLDAAPAFQISARADGSTISSTSDRTAHGYLPSRAEMRATFIASGKGIKQGQRIEYGRLIDIAPTIARLLGLEMKTARGRVFSEVIAQ